MVIEASDSYGDDFYDDEPYDEADEPDCFDCWGSESAWCWVHLPPPLRIRRLWARRSRLLRKRWRAEARHHNDRFWQARNKPTFDDEAPF